MAGVGLEYGLASNWSIKVEYNYMDFGGDTYRFNLRDSTDFFDLKIDQQVHVVKFGVNYRFGGPVVARY